MTGTAERAAEPAENDADDSATQQSPVDDPRAPWWVLAGVTAAVAAGVVARFIPRGELWLDEALSANIAELGPSGAMDALRRDGHPPLYYWLLDLWSSLVGDSAWALRSLSAIVGVVTLPLVWMAGRRLVLRQDPTGTLRARQTATAALVITALLPFTVRYSSETRMYALVVLLVVVGYLLVDAHLRRPRWWTLLGLAVTGSALLWSHYWALWLLGAVGIVSLVVAWRAHRDGERSLRTAAFGIAGALVVAGLTFLPWIPTLLYQGANTGTPWGDPVRPATFAVLGMIYLAGGAVAEPQLVAYLFAGLLVLGVVGTTNRRGRVELGWRVAPNAQPEAILVVLTMALAWVAAFASRAAFAARYLAVLVPLIILVAALGLSAIRVDRWRRIVAVVLLAGFAVGIVAEIDRGRTQSGAIADAVVAAAAESDTPPLLVVCPDQNGPSIERALRARGAASAVKIVTYPALGDPRFVDWVDYAARNAAADPAAIAGRALDLAAGRTILYAYTGNYRTLEGQCEALLQALATARGAPAVLVPPEERNEDEPAIELLRFAPA